MTSSYYITTDSVSKEVYILQLQKDLNCFEGTVFNSAQKPQVEAYQDALPFTVLLGNPIVIL